MRYICIAERTDVISLYNINLIGSYYRGGVCFLRGTSRYLNIIQIILVSKVLYFRDVMPPTFVDTY